MTENTEARVNTAAVIAYCERTRGKHPNEHTLRYNPGLEKGEIEGKPLWWAACRYCGLKVAMKGEFKEQKAV